MHREIKIEDAYRKNKDWKFCVAGSEMAEFQFLDSLGLNINYAFAGLDYPLIRDGDKLTYSYVYEDLSVKIVDDKSIDKIVLMPRNDGNDVYPGHKYELLYYDMAGWQSLGVKEARNIFVTYDSVPANALLWLRNHTEGKEERVFTYRNGQLKFW